MATMIGEGKRAEDRPRRTLTVEVMTTSGARLIGGEVGGVIRWPIEGRTTVENRATRSLEVTGGTVAHVAFEASMEGVTST